MMEVFHLFPPLDKVTAEAKACTLHMEALSVSHLILEQLLAHVVAPVGEEEQCSPGRMGDGDMESEEEEEEANFPSLELESNSIPPVTDEMREVDKQSRLQVLLKLLQLACVMVRIQIQKPRLLNLCYSHILIIIINQIRNGDDVTFVFASTLPKLFRAPTPNITVKFNKQKLQK